MATMSHLALADYRSSFTAPTLPRLLELDEVVRRPSTITTLTYRDLPVSAGQLPPISHLQALPRMPTHDSTMSSPTLSSSGSATSDGSVRSQFTTTTTVAPRRATGVPQKRSASPTSDFTYCDDCEAASCTNPAKHAKKMKERKARKLSGQNTCALEETVFSYVGWQSPNAQSRGNGNAAGLHSVKIDVQGAGLDLLQYCLDKEYKQALRNGTEAEFRRITSSIANRSSDTDHVRENLLLRLDIDPCERLNSKSPVCKTHGEPDWRQCRRGRVDVGFNDNVEQHKLELQRKAETRYSSRL